jgi:hypothetical protein
MDARRAISAFVDDHQATKGGQNAQLTVLLGGELFEYQDAGTARQTAHSYDRLLVRDDEPLARDCLAAMHGRSYSPWL